MIQHNMQTFKVRKSSFCHFVISSFFMLRWGVYIGGVGVRYYLYIIFILLIIYYISDVHENGNDKMTK